MGQYTGQTETSYVDSVKNMVKSVQNMVPEQMLYLDKL